jgi:hypothetical protein
MDWDALVLRAGDRAQPFGGAVPVTGADFDAVAERHALDGSVEGWATVTGTWTGHQFRIERQSKSRPPPAPAGAGVAGSAVPAAVRWLAARHEQPPPGQP